MAKVLDVITRLGGKTGSPGAITATLGLMVADSIRDISWPANHHCNVPDDANYNKSYNRQVIT